MLLRAPLLAVAAVLLLLHRVGPTSMKMGDMQMPMPAVFPGHSSNLAEEVERISKALALEPGSRYAEVGGGNGLLFGQIAPRTMPGGAVYGTGVNEAEVAAMDAAAATAGVPNAIVVVAEPRASGLPSGCCDAILLRMVYHMLEAPADYLRDFRSALRPGGRLLLLEHDSDNGKTGRKGAKLTVTMPSGMVMNMPVVPPAALLAEAAAAGFEVESAYWPHGEVEPWPYFSDPAHGDDERGYAVLLKSP